MSSASIRPFFDEATNTVSYLVFDPATRQGAVIDPVLDWDHRSGEADTRSADRLIAAAQQEGVAIALILETHAHADHLTAAPYIKQLCGGKIGIGEHIKDVQRIFRPVFAAEDVKPEGGDFDLLFRDGQHIALGSLDIEVIHTPGHTPACVCYRIGDDVFVGDSGGDARLQQEPGPGVVVGGRLGRQQFHGDRSTQDRVTGLINLRHAAAEVSVQLVF